MSDPVEISTSSMPLPMSRQDLSLHQILLLSERPTSIRFFAPELFTRGWFVWDDLAGHAGCHVSEGTHAVMCSEYRVLDVDFSLTLTHPHERRVGSGGQCGIGCKDLGRLVEKLGARAGAACPEARGSKVASWVAS